MTLHRPSLRDLVAATREIRSGKLAAATALIQSTLRGGVSQDSAPGVKGDSDARGTLHRLSWKGRPYRLYVPPALQGQDVALVVMLHGCTQTPEDFAAGTRMNAAADGEACLVAYPEQLAGANPQRCWNWFNPADQQRDGPEPAAIAGVTQAVLAGHSIDPGRIYIAGLSAGGAMAAIMGAAYPDLFAAVGVHSGLACGAASDMPTAFAAMRQGHAGRALGRALPTIVFHGDQDRTVSPANAEAVIRQAGRPGLKTRQTDGQVTDGRAWRQTSHSDPAGHTMLEQWTVLGSGHAWSGGSPLGSFTDPLGPDATHEMLRFFRRQRRRG